MRTFNGRLESFHNAPLQSININRLRGFQQTRNKQTHQSLPRRERLRFNQTPEKKKVIKKPLSPNTLFEKPLEDFVGELQNIMSHSNKCKSLRKKPRKRPRVNTKMTFVKTQKDYKITKKSKSRSQKEKKTSKPRERSWGRVDCVDYSWWDSIRLWTVLTKSYVGCNCSQLNILFYHLCSKTFGFAVYLNSFSIDSPDIIIIRIFFFVFFLRFNLKTILRES